ncbi:MAG: hypothetical protein R2713_10470 [Ilumatobacteraceae bacterium]
MKLSPRPPAVNLGRGSPTPTDRTRCSTPGRRHSHQAEPVPARARSASAHGDRRAPARFYGLAYGRQRVLVTAGATEALAGALLGLLDTGDEVVLFRPDVRRLSGVRSPRRGDGEASDLAPTHLRLRSRRAPRRSRRGEALLVNTPHNPSARCSTAPRCR